MFYIISIITSYNGTNHYFLYDSYTDYTSTMDSVELLVLLLSERITIQNCCIENGTLMIKPWYKSIHKDPNNQHACVAVGRYGEDRFRIVDNSMCTKLVDKSEIIKLIQEDNIANCRFNKSGQIECIDVPTIETNNTLINYIKTEYDKFIAKSKLLGRDNAFTYEINGNEVRLMSYVGKSKDVLIPSFITIIHKHAFVNSGIKSVRVGKSVRFIGAYAFMNCNLSEVVIPETVEIMRDHVFKGNLELILHPSRIHINKSKTLVLED